MLSVLRGMNEERVLSYRSQTGGGSVLFFKNRSGIDCYPAPSCPGWGFGKQFLMFFCQLFEPGANPVVIINSPRIFDDAAQLPDGMRLSGSAFAVEHCGIGNAEHKNRPNAGQQSLWMFSCLEISDEVRHFAMHSGLEPAFKSVEIRRRQVIRNAAKFKTEFLCGGK